MWGGGGAMWTKKRWHMNTLKLKMLLNAQLSGHFVDLWSKLITITALLILRLIRLTEYFNWFIWPE